MTFATPASTAAWKVVPQRLPGPDILMPSATNIQGKIVVICRENSHVSDTSLQEWTLLPPMPTLRRGFAMTTLDDTVFVMGGRKRGSYSNVVESVSIRANGARWKALPSMTTERFCCAAATVNGSIVVVGGNNDESAFPTAEMFCFDDMQWTPLPNMSRPRANCAAAAVGNKVFVFGGCDGDTSESALNTAESFDVSSRTWESLPTMPNHRFGGTAVAIGAFILLIGGRSQHDDSLAVVDCFDTAARKWIQGISPLNTGRFACAATCMEQEEVYVFGGMDKEICSLDTVEKIKIDPTCHLIPSRLLPVFQQDDFPLGLWPFVISSCPLGVVHSILLSERFQLDAVLLCSKQTARGTKRKAMAEATNT